MFALLHETPRFKHKIPDDIFLGRSNAKEEGKFGNKPGDWYFVAPNPGTYKGEELVLYRYGDEAHEYNVFVSRTMLSLKRIRLAMNLLLGYDK